MYFRARAYDPELGRFIQNDPNDESRISAHYTYAANLPTMFTDRTGRQTDADFVVMAKDIAHKLANNEGFQKEVKFAERQRNRGLFGLRLHQEMAKEGGRRFGQTASFEVEIFRRADGKHIWGKIETGVNAGLPFNRPATAELVTRLDGVKWLNPKAAPKPGDIVQPVDVQRYWDWKTGKVKGKQSRKMQRILFQKPRIIRRRVIGGTVLGALLAVIGEGAVGANALASAPQFKGYLEHAKKLDHASMRINGRGIHKEIAKDSAGFAEFVWNDIDSWLREEVRRIKIEEAQGFK